MYDAYVTCSFRSNVEVHVRESILKHPHGTWNLVLDIKWYMFIVNINLERQDMLLNSIFTV